MGVTLRGKTVGVIGMGNIGRRVASYREMLSAVDILTIHVPLTRETRDMIGYAELSVMKRTAILINASRGGIVNETDLQRALTEGLVWGAGLDAHEQEPPTVEKDGELWKLPNVVSTPHLEATREDARLVLVMGAVYNLFNCLKSQIRLCCFDNQRSEEYPQESNISSCLLSRERPMR